MLERSASWVLCLVCVLSLAPVGAAHAQVVHPRVVVSDTETIVEGLPAVSADGRTVVVPSETYDRDGTSSLGVSFYDVGTGRYVEGWQVFSRDQDGGYVDVPDQGHGATPWRRARNLTNELAARGFVALTELASDPAREPSTAWQGAGLRLTQDGARVELRDVRGALRLRRSLGMMRAFCGMSDDAPHRDVPLVLTAFADEARRVLLLRYGIVYASCMCDDDLVTRAFRFSRGDAR